MRECRKSIMLTKVQVLCHVLHIRIICMSHWHSTCWPAYRGRRWGILGIDCIHRLCICCQHDHVCSGTRLRWGMEAEDHVLKAAMGIKALPRTAVLCVVMQTSTRS